MEYNRRSNLSLSRMRSLLENNYDTCRMCVRWAIRLFTMFKARLHSQLYDICNASSKTVESYWLGMCFSFSLPVLLDSTVNNSSFSWQLNLSCVMQTFNLKTTQTTFYRVLFTFSLASSCVGMTFAYALPARRRRTLIYFLCDQFRKRVWFPRVCQPCEARKLDGDSDDAYCAYRTMRCAFLVRLVPPHHVEKGPCHLPLASSRVISSLSSHCYSRLVVADLRIDRA